jgi:hypothetical protein
MEVGEANETLMGFASPGAAAALLDRAGACGDGN